MLILAVALLFGQAMADLNLPNYMSNIVNVGIQQGGIENAAPEAISADGLTLMKTFMTDAQKQSVESNYQKISAGDENYTGKYPLALSKDIYVRKDVDEETQAFLDLAFGEATWTFINTAKKLSAESGQEIASTDSGEMNVGDIDFSELYKMQPMLDRVPDTVIEEARQQAQANGESMMLQTGAAIDVYKRQMLALLWVFQIVFLNDFYKSIKIKEINSSADKIASQIDSDTLEDTLYSIAQDTQNCIMIVDRNGMVCLLYTSSVLPWLSAGSCSRMRGI